MTMNEQRPTKETQLLERFYYDGWNKANEDVLRQVLDEHVEFRGTFRRKPLRKRLIKVSVSEATSGNKIPLAPLAIPV